MPDDGAARDRIKRLLECGGVSLDRARSAVDAIPRRLLGYYEAELGNPARHDAIEHELRLTGELLSRRSTSFECRPYDSRTRCDALLVVAGTEIECELTAWMAPAATVAINRVCDRVTGHLRERFPGRSYRVGISNFWWPFPVQEDGRIDQDALLAACIADLSIAIDQDGEPTASWPAHHVGPVAEIANSGYMECSQTGTAIGGPVVFEQLKRKVMGKVENAQASGERPWMLGVVLDVWPEPEQIDRGANPSIAEQAFAHDPNLCCIAEVPRVLGAPCRLIWPALARGLGAIAPDVRQGLVDGWDFTYEHALLL